MEGTARGERKSDTYSGLRDRGVLDLLRRQEVPLVGDGTRALLLTVDEDLEGLIGVQDEGVDVRELVGRRRDLVLDQVVGALVVEDGMDTVAARTADVGAEHDAARRMVKAT